MNIQQRNSNNPPLPKYPIELDFPDLSAFKNSNTNIPYVFTFNSGKPGKHVMINGITHGNEVCGAIVIKSLLEMGLRPRVGKLTLSFSNVAAYEAFDSQAPDDSRFIDQDFNRLWSKHLLRDLTKQSVELNRARQMWPVLETVDWLLDLHSMHEDSVPLVLSGPLEKGIKLATALGVPKTVIIDEGHSDGCRMRDYGGFGSKKSKKNALLIECGQHWAAKSVVIAKQSVARFLLLSRLINKEDLQVDWWPRAIQQSELIKVTDQVVAKSMRVRFTDNFTGLEVIKRANTTIGWDGDQPIKTPYDHCVLVMPSLRQLRPGVTVCRFGKKLNI